MSKGLVSLILKKFSRPFIRYVVGNRHLLYVLMLRKTHTTSVLQLVETYSRSVNFPVFETTLTVTDSRTEPVSNVGSFLYWVRWTYATLFVYTQDFQVSVLSGHFPFFQENLQYLGWLFNSVNNRRGVRMVWFTWFRMYVNGPLVSGSSSRVSWVVSRISSNSW